MNGDAEAMFARALAVERPELTAQGAARRSAMRSELQAAVVHRRQVRHGVRAVLGLLVLLTGSWLWWPQRVANGGLRIEQVHDQPGLVAELSIHDSGSVHVEVIADDDTLRQLLDEAGQESGLIRLPGKLILESPSVVTE
jgi:hypothetical protein